MNTKWYTYVILCADGSLYKEHTNDLKRRYREHCNGLGANHTKKHKPIKLVYYEIFDTLKQAVEREKYFKTGSGRDFLKKKVKDNEQDR